MGTRMGPRIGTRGIGRVLVAIVTYSTKPRGGVVHALPRDLREALTASTKALDAWSDITPLATYTFGI